jgi:hypothetical protein
MPGALFFRQGESPYRPEVVCVLIQANDVPPLRNDAKFIARFLVARLRLGRNAGRGKLDAVKLPCILVDHVVAHRCAMSINP